jgi:hypothetical protein
MPSVVEALNRKQWLISCLPKDLEAVSTAVQLRHYNYDVKLNKLQKRALRFTWHRLHTRNGGKRVENVFEEVGFGRKIWVAFPKQNSLPKAGGD